MAREQAGPLQETAGGRAAAEPTGAHVGQMFIVCGGGSEGAKWPGTEELRPRGWHLDHAGPAWAAGLGTCFSIKQELGDSPYVVLITKV